MPANPQTLDAIVDFVRNDPGLPANIVSEDINGGAAAAILMNEVIMTAIEATGVNEDGRLTPDDLRAISDYIRATPDLYARFVEGHGDDEGNEETGFHLVQGDGGAYRFQGRDFIDTVADAIYHVGFAYQDGRFRNEDGNANETVDDVAGWMNYFVNGQNVVYGTSAGETLHSGHYSFDLAAAANEIFEAGAGNDKIWAGDGNDTVHGGAGNDTAGGGTGNDRLIGDGGDDRLWGEEGNDLLVGGDGNDRLGGGDGNDLMFGGIGVDKMSGDAGDDRMSGQSGADEIWGNDGDDIMSGGDGADRMGGGAGDDVVRGDAGNDTLFGNEGKDHMVGGVGNDTLHGNEDDDVLLGQSGDDKLLGGDGTDRLLGGQGQDELVGGNGVDVFIGGAGADRLLDWEDTDSGDIFLFRAGDSGVAADQMDVIEGFDSGTDKIHLKAFGGLDFIEGDAFSGNGSGEVLFDGDFVQIDANGDGTVDAMIEVKWVNELAGSDFIL